MNPLLVVSIPCFLISVVSAGLTFLAIEDQVEEGLDIPIDDRPSWNIFRWRGSYPKYLQRHRRVYPRSRLRLWHWLTLGTTAASFVMMKIALSLVR